MIKEFIYKKINKITCKKLVCERFWANKLIDIVNNTIDGPVTEKVMFLKIMISDIKTAMRNNSIINVLVK